MKKFEDFVFLHLGNLLGEDVPADLFAFGRGPFRRESQPGPGSFYAPNFLLDSKEPFLCCDKFELVSRTDLLTILGEEFPSSASSSELERLEWQQPDFEEYKACFESFQGFFAEAALEKAVPVVFERASCSNLRDAFPRVCERVLAAPAPLMPYALCLEDQGMVGASPEILFDYEGQESLRSIALAGSRPVERELELLSDPKELREQRLVWEMIAERLSDLGSVQTGRLGIMSLRKVSHLKVDLVCDLRNAFDFQSTVNRIHPTPALGYSPCSTKMDLSLLDPKEERIRFGAPFAALLPDGRCRCIVAIRNVQFDGDEFLLGSGAGILKESILDTEWEELAQKRASVKEILF